MKKITYFSADPHEIFLQAEYFNEACKVLGPEKSQKPYLIIPIATCGSFSLELYLKCLLSIQSPKNEFPAIHNLHTLYSDVEPQHKKIIEFFFQAISQTDSMVLHERVLRQSPLSIEEEIDLILQDNDSAFEGFRYAFGMQNAKMPTVYSTHSIRMSVRALILSTLKPDWNKPLDFNQGFIIPAGPELEQLLKQLVPTDPAILLEFPCPKCKAPNRIQFQFIAHTPLGNGFRPCPHDRALPCKACGGLLVVAEVVAAIEKVRNRKVL